MAMSDAQFGLVYNILSFSLASMMATTLFLWMRVPAVKNQYQSALTISGMVTFIAAYHYLRIFNSWVEAYEYKPNKSGEVEDPVLTGVPFNDAYRYMDWLLTVPMLLIEIVFVMKLPDDQIRNKSIALGVSSGSMICVGSQASWSSRATWVCAGSTGRWPFAHSSMSSTSCSLVWQPPQTQRLTQ